MKNIKKHFATALSVIMVGTIGAVSASAVDLTDSNVKVYAYSSGCSTDNPAENIVMNDPDCLKDILSKFDCLQDYLDYCAGLGNGECDDSITLPTTPQPTEPTAPTAPTNPQPTEPTAPTTHPSDSNNSQTVSEYEKRVVELVNEARSSNGLSPLTLNTELSNVARIRSQDMKDKGYFSHTTPTYGSPFDMMKSFGISYKTAGENIAKGYATPEAVVAGWMNSEGHRENILKSSFTEIGVGYVADGNYWTQMFIG